MTDRKNRPAFATRAIHAGQEHDPLTGAVMQPIYQTSTYAQESPGVHKGFVYARGHNPTRYAYERCIADLENGARGFAFASGMAAIGTMLELAPAGAHVIAMDDVYGGTFRLFERVRRESANLSFSYVDLTKPENLEAAITPQTKMVWLETPTNPPLKIADIKAVNIDLFRSHRKGELPVTFIDHGLHEFIGNQQRHVELPQTTVFAFGADKFDNIRMPNIERPHLCTPTTAS